MAPRKYPTKIIPPDYSRVFERHRLFELAEQNNTAKVMWVHGAPGAGKTVFVSSWLKKQQAPYLWYRIDASENHFADLFYFLTLATQRNYQHKKLKLPVFTSEYANNIENFARVFFREFFSALADETAIALDNCQELEQDMQFPGLLQIMANELPQGIQIICISRNRPSVALQRWQLSNELLEIGNSELSLDLKESGMFLKWLDPTLTDSQIEQIQIKTQGWAAGMVLMARQYAVRGVSVEVNSGINIVDYLASETLSHFTKELREFLVASALFTQLTAEMGMQLTGCRQAKSYLDDLAVRNMLIEHTASSAPIYRFHPLFREFLLMQADMLFDHVRWRQLQYSAAALLIEQGASIEAMMIYQELQEWELLKALLLQHAAYLISSGRRHAVTQWVAILPDEYLKDDAWLRYWQAIALKPSEPLQAEELLEECYQQFIGNHDIKGIYSTWIAAVKAIVISWDDFSRLKVWMNRFDELRKHYPACPSMELKIQFYSAAIHGLTIYNSQHPWLRKLIRISERLFRLIPTKIAKILLGVQLTQYYMFHLQLTKTLPFIPYLESALDDETLPPMIRIMSAYLLVARMQLTADTTGGLEYANKGLEISRNSGIHLFEGMILVNVAGCHVNNGDLINAENALQKAVESFGERQRIPVVMHCASKVWLATLNGDLQYALEQNQQALQLAKLIHYELACSCFWSFEVQICAELCQWDKAEQALFLLSKATQDPDNKYHLIQFHIAEAWLRYRQQDEPRTLSAVNRLLHGLRVENIFACFGWRPNILTPLCLLAIEHGIEQPFAVKLLKKLRLLDSPPLYLEQWPWPVRIYSFGTLSVQVEEQPLQPSHLSKKVAELLETLIILGGRNININQLAETLWPDAEGDLARQSLEITLHRLRKYIGKEAVSLSSGLISLNERYCWLDLWAFESTITEIEKTLNGEQPVSMAKLTDRLLTIHQDIFLKHSDAGLAIAKQEQLLNKLTRVLDLAISFHDNNGDNERVGLLLAKQLELKPVAESNYRRLMVHYIKHGQPDLALQIFQQCDHILRQGFHIPLSIEIQSLAKQLENAR